MIRENFENFVDGQAIHESEIATVIQHFDDLTIFQNDNNQLFFLSVGSEMFELGTVCAIKELRPFNELHPMFPKVDEVLKGGN